MASIAYVADLNMIEYHRVHGSKTMNFWRLSNSKRFSDFNPGDFLFFLVNTVKRTGANEKGIVGYGHFKKQTSMTVKQMWSTYKNENGYHSQQDFHEAIMKATKNKQLPDKINSIVLENVVFFGAPVYLSEFGISISKQLESYFYLDKEDSSVTSQILSRAKETGIDLWTLAINDEEEQENYFGDEEIHHMLTKLNKEIVIDITPWEEKKSRKWIKQKMIDKPKSMLISGSKIIAYEITKTHCELYVPLPALQNYDVINLAMISKAAMIKHKLEMIEKKINVQVNFLSDKDVTNVEAMINR